jgi:hypothetical protein
MIYDIQQLRQVCLSIQQRQSYPTSDKGLCLAYNACLANLAALRDKHIVIVARYDIFVAYDSMRNSERRTHS